eukprot:jgi/Picre1/34842/NNA_002308.t1
MEQRLGERYVCPREIVWLNGAPGSGKGTNVPFIMKSGVFRGVLTLQMSGGHQGHPSRLSYWDVWNVRATDVNEALCRRRYQVFKAHYNTILRLKSYFPFSLIDAMGSLQDCRSQIVRELRYQSSLDLDEKTYAAIRHLPLARDLVRVARQRLVFRLDLYCKKHYKMFTDIITHFVEERLVPRRVDMKTGAIQTESEDVHSFRITFNKENIRDVSLNHGSHTSSQNEQNMIIGKTFVPEHLRKTMIQMPWYHWHFRSSQTTFQTSQTHRQ